ncbi:MAG: hypothetical protein RML56_08850 [Burkholderiales bacterium]|nr:hypothetical protein [Burkholderiales bacterium]MDW8469046.1 hypothetical protein [Burkholderiales bacterium]
MSRKRGAPKPVWERGYKGHVLWQGKAKLGRVVREGEGRYAWEAAGRAGVADDLASAKRSVEQAVAMAGKQLDLFG